MKKIIITLVLLLSCMFKIQAQSNTVTLGGEASGSGGTATFTSGETFYEYKESASASLVEGVQQGVLYEFSKQPASTTICATVGSTASLSAVFNNAVASYTWQYKDNTTAVWTNINSSNAGTVYANYSTATLAITRSDVLPSTDTQYRVIVNSANGLNTSSEATLTVIPAAVAGTIATSTPSVCIGSAITYTLSGHTGASIQWQSLTSSNALSGTVVGTGDSYTANNAIGTFQYVRAVVTSGNCSTAITAVKTITVNPISVGGAITGGGTVCSGSSGIVKATGYSGTTLLWEYSTDGVNFVEVPALVGIAASTFVSNTNNNSSASYLFTNITGTTYFRFKSKNGECNAAYSNVIQYSIVPTATAGTITGLTSLCSGTGTSLTLTDSVGTIVWQKSTNWTAATPTWSLVSGTTESLVTGNLSVSTAYRAILTIATCTSSAATTSNFVVNVAPTAFAGSITTNVASVCIGGSITYTLSGYVGSAIQWHLLSSTSAMTGTVIGTGASYTASNVSGTALYVRAIVSSGTCSTAISSVKANSVNPLSVGGIITGGGEVCSGSSGILTVSGHAGSIYQWECSTDGVNYVAVPELVGTASASFNSNSVSNNRSSYLFTNITGTTFFRFKSIYGACAAAYSNVVKYTVSQAVAGTITGGDVTVCGYIANGATLDTNGTPLVLPVRNSTTLYLHGSNGVIEWQKSIDFNTATPTWSAAGGTSTSFVATNLTADSWYRALITNGVCSATTAVTKISVDKAAKAGITAVTTNGVGTTSVCVGGNITFTSAAFTGSSIQWEISTTSSTAGFEPVLGATGTSFTMNNVTYTPLSKFFVRSVVISGTCTLARSAVTTITVNPLSVAGSINGGGILCPNGTSTVALSGNTGVIRWEYSTDGITYFDAPYWQTVSGVATYFNPNGTTEFSTAASTGIAAKYVLTNFNAAGTVYMRARIKSGACSETYSNSVLYVNRMFAEAGVISAFSTTICSSTGTTLKLTGSVGTIQWQKATLSAITGLPGTFTNINGQVGTTLSTGSLTTSTAYQAVVNIGNCSTVIASYVSVFVASQPISKTITSFATSPSGSISSPLCIITPQKVLTIGSGYTGTIQWQSSTLSTTAGFTNIEGQTGVAYTVANPKVGANYYRASFTNSCGVVVYNTAVTLYFTSCATREVPGLEVQIAEIPFSVIAYPNPFAGTFNLSLTTTSADRVGVMVYDMIGKLIETREVSLNEVYGLQVGDRYPSGVYNVVVTQGEQTKTVRVVKK